MKTMMDYLVSDLENALKWLPLGILAAVLCVVFIRMFWKKKTSELVYTALFVAYLFVVLCITFWSRESGSRSGFDMRIGSTWGINERNNAFVIENVLLFVPLGILAAQNFSLFRNLLYCTVTGFLFSAFIETLQLLTGRGFFQIDDILTNTLGMFLGGILYWVLCAIVWLIRRFFLCRQKGSHDS